MTIKATIELDPRIDLKVRRTISGDILIMDHEDIDVVLMVEKRKCVTFPKENLSDKVYSSQDRMFRFLAKRGLISQSAIRGGNVFGALEAEMLESKIPGIDVNQAFLYAINEYINGEKKYFKSAEEYDDERLDSMLRPSAEDSTEFGEVPQSDKKGSMDSRVRPYGFMYNYSLVREGESDD
tara:strand:+ start:233 stop:775 length:543 start_codon:yes stop_codon:yes gene_type:complete